MQGFSDRALTTLIQVASGVISIKNLPDNVVRDCAKFIAAQNIKFQAEITTRNYQEAIRKSQYQ